MRNNRCRWFFWVRLFLGVMQTLFYVTPVDEVIEPALEVFGAGIAVVYVVAVLPDVAAENRCGAVNERVFAVGGFHDFQFVVFQREPRPAAAKLGGAGGDEILPHLVEAAKVAATSVWTLAGRFVPPTPEVPAWPIQFQK